MINTIQGRQAIAFTILLLGLLLSGLLGSCSLERLAGEFDEGMQQVRELSATGTKLQRDVLELIFAAEGYLATGDRDAKRRFTQLAGSTQQLAERHRALEEISTEEAQLVERLVNMLTQLEVEFARAHALYDIGRREEARRVADAAQPLAEEVTSVISQLSNRQSLLVSNYTEALKLSAWRRSNYVLLIVFIALVLSIGLAYVTMRSIDQPLSRLVAAADRLRQGQLDTRVSGERMPKEFATLATALDSMSTSMRDIASQVINTASQLSSSASDFSAISEQIAASAHEVANAMSEISHGADNQARALGETATAVVELREGTSAMESQANQNRDLSQSIREQADGSQEEIRRAVSLMLSLREVVRSSGEEIERLQTASDQITGFVRRIGSIAEQTHLLSLNAAIEAAHAGHEGRGFGVVAEEVGKLAAEADGAAREVEEVVAQLRGWIEGAVLKMHEGEGQVVLAEGVARRAEEALDTITAGLVSVSAAMDQALATMERSRSLLEQVAGHVESVTATATDHAARSQDVSAAVQEQSATHEQFTASVTELVSAAQHLRRAVGSWEV